MNVERVNQVLDLIDDGHLDMGNWAIRDDECGTAMCLAGWACVAAGDPPAFMPGMHWTEVTASGAGIAQAAATYLGLLKEEVEPLFHCAAGTVADLRVAVRVVAGGTTWCGDVNKAIWSAQEQRQEAR